MRARKFGNIDSNHLEIANALRKAGYSVGEVSAAANFVDLVVADILGMTVLLEIKTETGKFYLSQLETIGNWKGNVCFVNSAEDALEKLKTHKFLTNLEKEKILRFAYRQRLKSLAKNPQVAVKKLEKELGL